MYIFAYVSVLFATLIMGEVLFQCYVLQPPRDVPEVHLPTFLRPLGLLDLLNSFFYAVSVVSSPDPVAEGLPPQESEIGHTFIISNSY